ncbi:winged helix-turn-helix transcriptional regulator [Deinococcus hohokamensis]|uniref:Winged helix-turn-helix transcriptional regulator n=1 Tax=Deinococcus hohokamensis TaxID=309883 RepID=A0ABV9I917_9DEIO
MECIEEGPGGAAAALKLLQARSALPVIQVLLQAPTRFNELQQRSGAASATTLRARLLDLQRADVVTRAGDRYVLTPRGQALRAVFDALATFHHQHPHQDPHVLLTALQRRYAMRVMRELIRGEQGFNELCRLVQAASPTTLTRRLADLEQLRLIERTVQSTMPPRTTYAHSQLGRDFSPVVGQMVLWGEAQGIGISNE